MIYRKFQKAPLIRYFDITELELSEILLYYALLFSEFLFLNLFEVSFEKNHIVEWKCISS